jgi:hypothetical protein
MRCQSAVGGEIRLFGRGAFDGGNLVVYTNVPSSAVVVTASGHVLAGPVGLVNDARNYSIIWPAR